MIRYYTTLLIFCFICLFFLANTKAQTSNAYWKTNTNNSLSLTQEGANHFASLALNCLQQEYPNKLNQVLSNEKMLKSPKVLHPAFYGCFDWHSSVHGHWMLIRLLKEFPDLPQASEIRTKLAQNLSAENINAEVAYLRQASKSWERMYGWSWLLKLSEEVYTWEDETAQEWSSNLQPLTDLIIERYMSFLPIQQYPVRTGVHPNTAFGLSFAWDYANTVGHIELKSLIEQRANDYYFADANCPADWEPSGEDFLSACLEEANLMSRVLSPEEYAVWFEEFLPADKLQKLYIPADVADRSDPKIVHLDGVNLSRAWCFYTIVGKLESTPKTQKMIAAASEHLQASVPNIASEHYEGSHWLASFVVYAMLAAK